MGKIKINSSIHFNRHVAWSLFLEDESKSMKAEGKVKWKLLWPKAQVSGKFVEIKSGFCTTFYVRN